MKSRFTPLVAALVLAAIPAISMADPYDREWHSHHEWEHPGYRHDDYRGVGPERSHSALHPAEGEMLAELRDDRMQAGRPHVRSILRCSKLVQTNSDDRVQLLQQFVGAQGQEVGKLRARHHLFV